MSEKNNIVFNNTQGYDYSYASLSDIAKQGHVIPKMKVDTDTSTFKDYVFYYDDDLKQWIRGAEIIVPENIVSKSGKAKMNKAQLYGSALTYARRYTALLALQLVCGDDKNIEDGEEVIEEKTQNSDVDSIKNIQLQIITNNSNLITEELKQKNVKKPSELSNLSQDELSDLCRLIDERSKK